MKNATKYAFLENLLIYSEKSNKIDNTVLILARIFLLPTWPASQTEFPTPELDSRYVSRFICNKICQI
jgi:hypothetical protein